MKIQFNTEIMTEINITPPRLSKNSRFPNLKKISKRPRFGIQRCNVSSRADGTFDMSIEDEHDAHYAEGLDRKSDEKFQHGIPPVRQRHGH